MTDAFAGAGSVFKRSVGDSSSASFLTLAEVVGISGPDASVTMIDVTPINQANFAREFVAGVIDYGEVTLEMNFTRDTYLIMKSDMEDRVRKRSQIVLSDAGATTLEFWSLVSALGMATPLDDKVSASVTIKVSGKVDVSS